MPWTKKEDPLEEDMASHSSILAWRIPWTEDPGQLAGAQGAPRDPRRDSRGERSPWLPLERRRLKGSPLFRPEGRKGSCQHPATPKSSPTRRVPSRAFTLDKVVESILLNPTECKQSQAKHNAIRSHTIIPLTTLSPKLISPACL